MKPKWRPISEAPKDKPCLVFVPEYPPGEDILVCHYNYIQGAWNYPATHFMPLPGRPKDYGN